ncbi:hypothetical protein [Carnobacterium divergens]
MVEKLLQKTLEELQKEDRRITKEQTKNIYKDIVIQEKESK